MFEDIAKRFPDNNAIGFNADGRWNNWTYAEYLENIRNAAAGFLALGLERQCAVGIMGANSAEWALSSVGSIFAGGLSCGIYATNSPESVRHIVCHAPVHVLVLQDPALLERLLKGSNDISAVFPTVKKIVLMEGKSHLKDVITCADLMTLGRAQSPNFIAESLADRPPVVNEAAMLIYTSGTTGPPKGK